MAAAQATNEVVEYELPWEQRLDPLADFYFNLAGIIAFSFDEVAQLFSNDYLDYYYWPGQPIIDPQDNALFNQGEQYYFRTKFGFHILNVIDKRRSQGEITAAHIMIANNNDKITSSPKERINELWAKINEGSSFSDLAKQFSDDKNSARNGGELKRFGAGKLGHIEFENAAFALNTEGEVSKPIETKFGWHIIKLLKKHDVLSFNEQKSTLEQKIKKDSRSKIVNERFYENLKKQNFKYRYCNSK